MKKQAVMICCAALVIFLLALGCNNSNRNAEYISSEDCLSQGGQIIETHGNATCPEGMQNLGIVEDVNCMCNCCK